MIREDSFAREMKAARGNQPDRVNSLVGPIILQVLNDLLDDVQWQLMGHYLESALIDVGKRIH